jgi:hypothetical protein
MSSFKKMVQALNADRIIDFFGEKLDWACLES